MGTPAKTKFRKQGLALHLRITWKKQADGQPINLKEYINFVRAKVGKKSNLIFGRYHTGSQSTTATHCHVYVACDIEYKTKKFDIKNPHFFDWMGYHPTILVARGSPLTNWDYINKSTEKTELMDPSLYPAVKEHWLNEFMKTKHNHSFTSKKTLEKHVLRLHIEEGYDIADVLSGLEKDEHDKIYLLCKHRADIQKVLDAYDGLMGEIAQKEREKEFIKVYEESEMPWQKDALQKLEAQTGMGEHSRTIPFIGDPQGDNGKSWFSKYIEYKYKGFCVDSTNYKNFAALYKGQQKVVIDLSRVDDIDAISYKLLEKLKDGSLFSQKYHPNKLQFASASIIVTANQFPSNFEVFTPDRWDINKIIRCGDETKMDYRLVKGTVYGGGLTFPSPNWKLRKGLEKI